MENINIYTLIGATLLEIQKFEFLIHGLVSHFKNDILKKHKQFKDLDANNFLSNLEEDKKKRKQTLGQVIQVLKENFELRNGNELEECLHNRNIFVHHLWREFFYKNSYNIQECKEFLEKLNKQIDYWTKVFKGMLYVIMMTVLKMQTKEIQEEKIRSNYLETFEPYKQYEYLFYETLQPKQK